MRKKQLPLLIATGLLIPTALYAQTENVIELPEITVTADAEADKGEVTLAPEALPAQVEVITEEEIEVRPTNALNFLELFRRTPGVIPRSFGQGDIGEGVNIRGFDSGHGVNVAVFVDGVPLNVPSHAHSHGLANTSWLIPEIIERIEVIKGHSRLFTVILRWAG